MRGLVKDVSIPSGLSSRGLLGLKSAEVVIIIIMVIDIT